MSLAGRVPVLVNKRKKSVHKVWNFTEMGWDVTSHINWLLPETAAELRDIRNGDMIQCPERIFIQGFGAFLDSDLDTVC